MLLHETVQHCSTCEEVTPHSRRVIPLPKVLSTAAVAGAGWCFFQDVVWYVVGGLLLYAAVFLLLRDREKLWGICCERCRGKKLQEIRRSKPTLDGNTEIHIS